MKALLCAVLCLAALPARAAEDPGLAAVLLLQGRYQDAVAVLDATLKRRPDDASALANRCTARYKLGDHEGALLDFEAAVKLKPDVKPALAPSMSDAYYRRGLRLVEGGADDKASEALYAAVRLDRKNALAYNELGYLALRNKQPQTSMDYFDRAIKIDPDLAPAYANRAAALLAQRRPEQAFTDLDKAILLSPKTGAFFALRARASAALGRNRQAAKDAARAVTLDPKQAEAVKEFLPKDK